MVVAFRIIIDKNVINVDLSLSERLLYLCASRRQAVMLCQRQPAKLALFQAANVSDPVLGCRRRPMLGKLA
jgi:hypothetical protein